MSWPLFVLVCTLACGTQPPTALPNVIQTPTPTAIPTAMPSPTVSSESSVDTESDEAAGPEFAGISGWINSEPLRMADLRGKVVLIDFWTYTCINCIRTFPHLKEWHAKYADKGLIVVGVHSPEFLFETVRSNVEQAVADFGIEYPVAQDNLLKTWRAFGNRSWPGKFLVDKDGVIRFRHFGEGQYAKTEKRIRELLAETGVTVCHNASSNLRLRSGIAPVAFMHERGVNIGVGTDGGTLNDDDDMVQELRLVSKLHRLPRPTSPWVSPHDVIRMATLNGARATLRTDAIGKLEPGRAADIILVNLQTMTQPYLAPDIHMADAFVYRAKGTDVETVIIDGELVMENRTHLRFNKADLLEQLREAAAQPPTAQDLQRADLFRQCRPVCVEFLNQYLDREVDPQYVLNRMA